ncbi:MAG: hypothetical protein ACLFR2_13170 [Candidatus Kapaibacterium sp.]
MDSTLLAKAPDGRFYYFNPGDNEWFEIPENTPRGSHARNIFEDGNYNNLTGMLLERDSIPKLKP